MSESEQEDIRDQVAQRRLTERHGDVEEAGVKGGENPAETRDDIGPKGSAGGAGGSQVGGGIGGTETPGGQEDK